MKKNKYERIRDLRLDFKEFLCRQKKQTLRDMLQKKIDKMQIKQLSTIITDINYFGIEETYNTIKNSKGVDDGIYALLNEPKEEKQLRKPTINYFKNILGHEYITSDAEIKVSSKKESPIIDVCIFHEPKLIKPLPYIIAVELKSECNSEALKKAFKQASKHFDYAETVYVAISPKMYIELGDELYRLIDYNYYQIGVLVVDTARVCFVVRDTLANTRKSEYSTVNPNNKAHIYQQIPHPHFKKVKEALRMGRDLNYAVDVYGEEIK